MSDLVSSLSKHRVRTVKVEDRLIRRLTRARGFLRDREPVAVAVAESLASVIGFGVNP